MNEDPKSEQTGHYVLDAETGYFHTVFQPQPQAPAEGTTEDPQ